MYVISNSFRIYHAFFLCLCFALLFAPTLANANIPSTLRPDIQDMIREVRSELNSNVKRPSGSSLSTSSSSPTITKNAAGGLSATTDSVIRTMGQPSSYSSTLNYSLDSAKTALKSCVRSPACAGRALGAGAVIYEGVRAWKDVHGLIFDAETQTVKMPGEKIIIDAPVDPNPLDWAEARSEGFNNSTSCPSYNSRGEKVMKCTINNGYMSISSCGENWRPPYRLTGISSNGGTCLYSLGAPWVEEITYVPVTEQFLDDALLDYSPAVSDAPIVISGVSSESITLTTPAPAELPSTTTTNTDSNGQTTTSVTNKTIVYNVTNNSTSNPSVNSSLVETTTSFDATGNLTNTAISTTTASGVQPDVPPPSSSPLGDFELPPFCSWASIVCDWIGWTQEELGEEEPDLTVLISEFEPDEDAFSLGIGSGACPSPIQLNITFINKTVEVSYQPFCDFVIMIRPFILAAAYLFAAYLYIGVLRRG